jgi:hypothetical protein
MANMNRMSMYSIASSAPGSRQPNSTAQQSTQVSTTTLLNSVHAIYTSGQSHWLDASTSLVVNTWLTASQADHEGRTGGTVDARLSARAWEHARRRAEDGCIILGYDWASASNNHVLTTAIVLSTHQHLQYLHHSLVPFLSASLQLCIPPSMPHAPLSTLSRHRILLHRDNQLSV